MFYIGRARAYCLATSTTATTTTLLHLLLLLPLHLLRVSCIVRYEYYDVRTRRKGGWMEVMHDFLLSFFSRLVFVFSFSILLLSTLSVVSCLFTIQCVRVRLFEDTLNA